MAVTFLWQSADTAFTYIVPVVLEDIYHDYALVGIFVSFGAVAAIIIDLLSGWKFARFNYRFFFMSGFLVALAAAVGSVFLPYVILVMLGGIYYELLNFATLDYITEKVHYNEHTEASSMVLFAVTISSLIVPFAINPYIEVGDYQTPMLIFGGLMAMAMMLYWIYRAATRDYILPKRKHSIAKHSLITEFKVWRLLTRSTALVLVVAVFVSIMDAFFWTIGSLFVVEYADKSELVGLMIPLYMLPGLFVGPIASKIEHLGKERIAYMCMVLSGTFLAGFLLTDNIPILMLFNFISSIFSTLSYTLLQGLFADMTSRLGEDGNYLIGLQGFVLDLAYIAGPIAAGIVAQLAGVKESFAFIGVVCAVVSTAGLFLMHGKTRLPHKKITEVELEQ